MDHCFNSTTVRRMAGSDASSRDLRENRRSFLASGFALAALLVLDPREVSPAIAQDDPLPSWNASATKSAIIRFVTDTTAEGGKNFVPVEERIATFDNDGTLWSEQPFYFQLAYALDRIKNQVKANPSLAEREPYKSALSGDLAALGEKGLARIIALTHTGMTTSDFEADVLNWLKTARHPRFDRRYTELVFQPMLELLAYLRANDFKIYIVSGGGIEFMRPWMFDVYGIPPEQIIGSSGKTAFELNGDKPVIRKLPEIEFVDDGPGKPVGINRFIGRRPIFAAGNSDGDLQMLQWTTLADGPRLGLIIHHTDAERESAYDRKSTVGKLDKALDEAPKRRWLVVDMKADWKKVFPFQ